MAITHALHISNSTKVVRVLNSPSKDARDSYCISAIISLSSSKFSNHELPVITLYRVYAYNSMW